ncbi:MAG TPA: helix-turn-helix transcriptional regulator [Thermodesulfobacteriota bacterium]
MPRSTTRTLGEPDDLARQVGRRVRALRKARGLGEADIEARLFNFKYLQRIEAGQVNLTLRTLERLAEILETDVRTLLTD